jgi:hypothetical protein
MAEGFIIGFEHETDARRFWDAMRERLAARCDDCDPLVPTHHDHSLRSIATSVTAPSGAFADLSVLDD